MTRQQGMVVGFDCAFKLTDLFGCDDDMRVSGFVVSRPLLVTDHCLPRHRTSDRPRVHCIERASIMLHTFDRQRFIMRAGHD